jgi:hypothetical protein
MGDEYTEQDISAMQAERDALPLFIRGNRDLFLADTADPDCRDGFQIPNGMGYDHDTRIIRNADLVVKVRTESSICNNGQGYLLRRAIRQDIIGNSDLTGVIRFGTNSAVMHVTLGKDSPSPEDAAKTIRDYLASCIDTTMSSYTGSSSKVFTEVVNNITNYNFLCQTAFSVK